MRSLAKLFLVLGSGIAFSRFAPAQAPESWGSLKIDGEPWRVTRHRVTPTQLGIDLRHYAREEATLRVVIDAVDSFAIAYLGDGVIAVSGTRSSQDILFVLRVGGAALAVEAEVVLPARFLCVLQTSDADDVYALANDGMVYGSPFSPGSPGAGLESWSPVQGLPPLSSEQIKGATLDRRRGGVSLFAKPPAHVPLWDFSRDGSALRATRVTATGSRPYLEKRGSATIGGRIEIRSSGAGPVMLRSPAGDAPIATIAERDVGTWIPVVLPETLRCGLKHVLIAADGAESVFYPHRVFGAVGTSGGLTVENDIRINAAEISLASPVSFVWMRMQRTDLVEQEVVTQVLVRSDLGAAGPRVRDVGGQAFLVPDRILILRQNVPAGQRSVALSAPILNDLAHVGDRLCVQLVARCNGAWAVSSIVGVEQLPAGPPRAASARLAEAAARVWDTHGVRPVPPAFASMLQAWEGR